MATENQNYVSEKSSKKKGAWRSFAIFFTIILLVILACMFVFQILDWAKFEANPNNAYDTIQAFAYSLAYNKLDGVKSYISPSKWAFIESWPTRHEAISSHCKEPTDPDDGPSWMSSFDDNTQLLSMYFSFNQNCPDYFYMLRISAKLKRVDNKWQVIGWSEICERTTEEQCY
jgi:hypothetical protein